MVFSCFGSIAQRLPLCVLSGLGCGTVFVYVLGLFSFSFEVPKVPLRPLATDRFLLRVSSDLGDVSLFRIHCQKRLPVCVVFFASPELGFRWCLAVSDRVRRGCHSAFAQARLRPVFCLRTGALFFSVIGLQLLLRPLANDRFLPRLRSDLGGVWLFRVADEFY